MGGKAVKDVRPLNSDEVKPTYEWVKFNILPILGLDSNDAIPIGSFGKKPKNETSGDIDVAINAKKYLDEGLEFDKISASIDLILKESGFETTLLKGFDQVSVKVPINGNQKNGYAQVDLMPSPDLNWAKFMYHSPNLAEKESKYKGAVRNALLMALVSEPTKEITKLFENKAEEYNSLAIRFPTGLWNIKRSFMGKNGLVKRGTVLESEFITRDPQDIINIALGEGYKIDAANSFETLWEIIHRKDFVHKNNINEIMSKFLVNLKSMQQEIPQEILKKYPKIFEEGIMDILKPKTEEEIINSAKKLLSGKLDFYKLVELNRKGVLKILFDNGALLKDEIHDIIFDKMTKDNWYRRGIGAFIRDYKFIKQYLTEEELDKFILDYNLKQFKYRNPEIKEVPKTLKDIRKIDKDRVYNEKKNRATEFINLIKGNFSYKSLHRIIDERINLGQLDFLIKTINFYNSHKGSSYIIPFLKALYNLLDNKSNKIIRSSFSLGSIVRDQWGMHFLDKLASDGILEKKKKVNLQYFELNKDYKSIEKPSSHYYFILKTLSDIIAEYKLESLYESTSKKYPLDSRETSRAPRLSKVMDTVSSVL